MLLMVMMATHFLYLVTPEKLKKTVTIAHKYLFVAFVAFLSSVTFKGLCRFPFQ